MFLVRWSWTTGEGICVNLVCCLFRPPVSSLERDRLFVLARFGHGWPLLPDAAPLRSHARDGARTRKRESHLERICHLSSPAQIQRKYKGPKEPGFFKPPFLPKLPREEKEEKASTSKLSSKKDKADWSSISQLHSTVLRVFSWSHWCITGNTHMCSCAVDPASSDSRLD